MSSVTEQLSGSLFPQTTSTYRCTNEACQNDRDKETAKRVQQAKEKGIAEEQRKKERQDKKDKLTNERAQI